MDNPLGGTWGRSPKNLTWRGRPCIRPPIFWEVVLSDACEITNWVKKVSSRNLF